MKAKLAAQYATDDQALTHKSKEHVNKPKAPKSRAVHRTKKGKTVISGL
jgi:hypothetical protein